MISPRFRFFVIPLLAGLFLVFVLYLLSNAFRPHLGHESLELPRGAAEAAEALRDVSFDEQELVRIERAVDYSEGEAADWWPKRQSPVLDEAVDQGKLPPVSERVGSEPMVLQGVEGIGNYGGTWLRLMPGPGDLWTVGNRLAGSTLVRWSPLGYPIVPAVAKSWEVNEDATVWTFHLRKGMRWSDGHPFTSEDLLYHWEAEVLDLGNASDKHMVVNNQRGTMEALDEHTVVMRFPESNHLLLQRLTEWHGFARPAHYLRPYHPTLGDPEKIEASMKARNLGTPRANYNALLSVSNPELPSINPWIIQTFTSTAPYAFVRNPYYWAVDTEGNQLPYIDQLLFEVKDQRLLPVSGLSGGVHMQARYVRFEDYTLLMSGRDDGNYRLLHWFPATRSLWTLFPNVNRKIDPGSESDEMKHSLLNDRRFRQALSLAIDRESIIEAQFSGIGEPAQIAPGPSSFFHDEALMKAFTEHDPGRANALLDDLGLTGRDREGYRTFPDGSRMTWFIEYTQFTGAGPVQFVVADWRKVGIRAEPKQRNIGLFNLRRTSLLSDFVVWTSESDFDPLVQPRSYVPTYSASHHAIAYGTWFSLGGMVGNEKADHLPAPPEGSDIRRTMELLLEAEAMPTREDQREVLRKIFALNAENLWTISIATAPPALVIVRNDFRNVPDNAIVGWNYATPANAGLETYFFTESNNSPEGEAKIAREMFTVTPQSAVNSSTTPSSSWGSRLIRWLVIGIVVFSLALIGLRHPFIGRRILWAFPTLGIISVIVFGIVQAPPGSYIDTLIIRLQMTGDEAQVEEIEQLREMFHLDRPLVEQYVRWMGVPWFFSFDEADAGLLQGNLGRSMENRQSVNDAVGDRLILTVAISAGTILFTWLVALPIGIYSAVRQYSVGDYFFTLVGFIGLSVPNFLLALLLMFVSYEWFGVAATGLFSPEFAVQPGWSWPKFVDLLKHIWVPILVLGTAGTAGMIRIMRANLLDELKKPYVTTARAKGVRPFKLLIKYPVRMALNPFVSGIGGIFPALISGGSIVAIVLSLPTVGPLLLHALLSEDMYLAGSMLMLLSLLTVFGVLVSDLLLLMLDPRIRMEGGSR